MFALPLVALSLIGGCSPTALTLGDDGARPPKDGSDTEIEVLPGIDSGGSGDSGEAPADDTRIFTLDAVHIVAITLGDDGHRGLTNDPYTYVPADLTFDGETFPNVGVRIKGRLGSYRSLDQKAAFKVDLLEFGQDTELEGLEKFSLNNMVQDCAKTHEYAAYGVHRMLGVPAPRVAYAMVTVDGDLFGLYSLVEDYDDVFLAKNFADPTGNLYDGDYWLYPDGNYALVDFNDASQGYFGLDEGTDVALADVNAVTDALNAGATFADTLGGLVDLEEHAAFVAATAWTGHSDSYTYYSNNYRVYFDPTRGGRAVFMPWDPDWAFEASTAVTSFYGSVSARCYADPTCNAAVHAELDTLDAALPGSALVAELQTAAELLRPYLRDDPRLETPTQQIRACQDDLASWFERRGGELDAVGL